MNILQVLRVFFTIVKVNLMRIGAKLIALEFERFASSGTGLLIIPWLESGLEARKAYDKVNLSAKGISIHYSRVEISGCARDDVSFGYKPATRKSLYNRAIALGYPSSVACSTSADRGCSG